MIDVMREAAAVAMGMIEEEARDINDALDTIEDGLLTSRQWNALVAAEIMG